MKKSTGFGRATLLVGLATTSIPFSAAAGPGDHVNVGNGELVPYVTLGPEYRSNVYLSESDEQSGVNLKVFPGASFVLENSDVEFTADAEYNFRQYLGGMHQNLNRYQDFQTQVDLDVLPQSIAGIAFVNELDHRSRSSDIADSQDATTRRFRERADLALAVHPGSALEVAVGGGVEYAAYAGAETAASSTPFLNAGPGYGPTLQARWQFFPRTAVVFDSMVWWYDWSSQFIDVQSRYTGETVSNEVYGDYIAIPDYLTWRLDGGLVGQMTERASVNLRLGYGQMNFDPESVQEYASQNAEYADDAETSEGYDVDLVGVQGVIANLAFKYALLENHEVSIAYKKDFMDSYFTNYTAYHSALARYRMVVARQLEVQLGGAYRFETLAGEVSRQDHVVRVSGGVAYAANEWLEIGGGTRWDRRVSGFDDRLNGKNPEIEYDDVWIHGQMTFTY